MTNPKKLTAAAGCLSALLLLSACASGGNESIKNETAASVDQKIHDGVTTKQEVRTMFGDPAGTSFTDSGNEEWQYSFANDKMDAANFIPLYGDVHQSSHGTSKSLVIIFKNDRVWHHAMNSSNTKSQAGLF